MQERCLAVFLATILGIPDQIKESIQVPCGLASWGQAEAHFFMCKRGCAKAHTRDM